MNITPRDPVDRPLVYIGYNYDSWEVLWFIATEGYVSNDPGGTYLYRLP